MNDKFNLFWACLKSKQRRNERRREVLEAVYADVEVPWKQKLNTVTNIISLFLDDARHSCYDLMANKKEAEEFSKQNVQEIEVISNKVQ